MAPVQLGFFREWWTGYRPYGLRILVDLSVCISLLVASWLFDGLWRLFRTDGVAAVFMGWIHQIGAVTSFGAFVSMSALDIYRIARTSDHE